MKLDNNELITVCGGQDKTMLSVWSVCWTGLVNTDWRQACDTSNTVHYLIIVNKFNNLLNFLNVYQISSPELLAAVHQSCLPAPDSRHNTIKDTAIYYASCSSTTSVTINSLILVAVVQVVLSTAPAINDTLQRICKRSVLWCLQSCKRYFSLINLDPHKHT